MGTEFLDKNGLVKVWAKLKEKLENKANKVTTIDTSATDTEYPSAKAVNTYVANNTAQKHTSMHVEYEDGTEATIDFASWD